MILFQDRKCAVKFVTVATLFATMVQDSNCIDSSRNSSNGNVNLEQKVNPSLPSYGVDCSFPVHSFKKLRCQGGGGGDGEPSLSLLLGESRQTVYDSFIDGCKYKYGVDVCDKYERSRISQNLIQPQYAVNHTSDGYSIVRVPSGIRERLAEFWENNKHRIKEEQWPEGETAINHWESPTYIVTVGEQHKQKALRGTSRRSSRDGTRTNNIELKSMIQSSVQRQVEEWLGFAVVPATTLVDVTTTKIRLHSYNTIVPPHINQPPRSISATLNVAQDLVDNWIFEIYQRHNGSAKNITIEPGELLMMESGSIIHGNPFAMNGRYFASINFQFEPAPEATQRSVLEFPTPSAPVGQAAPSPAHQHKEPRMITVPSIEADDTSPPPQESKPTNGHGEVEGSEDPEEKVGNHPIKETETIQPVCHMAAKNGDLELMSIFATRDSGRHLFAKDFNGWEPIHEASRAGHLDVIKFLVDHGADINTITNFGRGFSPLRLAKIHHDHDHPIFQYFHSLGAIDHEPGNHQYTSVADL